MAGEGGSITVEKALAEIAAIRCEDQTPEELRAKYDGWSTYDEVYELFKYKGPEIAVQTLAKYLVDKRNVSILDVAAGTGLAGEELRKLGFENIDALDPSEGMLQTPRKKNIYKDYIIDYFPCQKRSISASTYDVLMICGGMAEGHLKCDCLPEAIRCVKPGGLVVISMGEHYLTEVAEYKDRLEPLMKELETEGQWKCLERTTIPEYYHTVTGVLFVYRVTKSDNQI